MPIDILQGYGVLPEGMIRDGVTDPNRKLAVNSDGSINTVITSGGLGVSSYAATFSVTRPNDTAAYAAGDVIGPATGSTSAFSLALGPALGGEVMLTSVTFAVDASAVISGMTSFNLALYSVTPPSALGDNVAWDLPSGDRASYISTLGFGVVLDVGSTLFVSTDQLNKQVTIPSGGLLYAYLITVGAFTPTANLVFRGTVHSVVL